MHKVYIVCAFLQRLLKPEMIILIIFGFVWIIPLIAKECASSSLLHVVHAVTHNPSFCLRYTDVREHTYSQKPYLIDIYTKILWSSVCCLDAYAHAAKCDFKARTLNSATHKSSVIIREVRIFIFLSVYIEKMTRMERVKELYCNLF